MNNYDDGTGWEPTPCEYDDDSLFTRLGDGLKDGYRAACTWPKRITRARHHAARHSRTITRTIKLKKVRARHGLRSWRRLFTIPQFAINYAGRISAAALTAGAVLLGTAFATAPSTAAAGAPNGTTIVIGAPMSPDDARTLQDDRSSRSEPRTVAPTTPPKPVWVTPLASYRFTDCWGAGRNHKGLDMAANKGTPIRAMHAGVIKAAGWKWRGYGISVLVKHNKGDKHYSHYAHMSKEIVSVGQQVVAGQIIGYVGATGDAHGNHLHFEVWDGMWGQFNPAPFMRSHGLKLKAGC